MRIKKGTGRETVPNGPQQNAATITDSTISISELLDYVNDYFPDILSEGVLKHYGYDARPEGKLGESALYSDRDPEMAKVNRVLEKENAKLREDVVSLKELLKIQRQVTGGTKFTRSSVEAAAGVLMKAESANGTMPLWDCGEDYIVVVGILDAVTTQTLSEGSVTIQRKIPGWRGQCRGS
ncbi:MAG: hypothetical protein ACI3V5_11180 [Faecousia sp.]